MAHHMVLCIRQISNFLNVAQEVLLIKFKIQVSVKNCEIGMAQISFVSYRLQHVDYLPWMYFYEFGLVGRKPLEFSSILALVYPFDISTWILSLLGTIMMFLILFIMQKLWSHASGETYFPEYLFQG